MNKISVVIPVYNGAKFIDNAIISVLSQKLPAQEIIVINDGSTDDTAKVLEKYQGRIAVKTISHGGVSRCRNAGIEASTGEWVAFLDADDMWYPEKLSRQAAALAENPGAEFCFCDYEYYQSPEKPKATHFADDCQNGEGMTFGRPFEGLAVLLRYNIVGTSGTLVKKTLIQAAGLFDPRYRQAEDYGLWLRCALRAQLLALREPLYLKTFSDSCLTRNWVETCSYQAKVLQEFSCANKRVLMQRGLWQAAARNIAANYYRLGDLHKKNRDLLRAGWCYGRGFFHTVQAKIRA